MANDLKEAIEILVTNLKNDQDYRLGWQANIAMSLIDSVNKDSDRITPEIANEAARIFLDRLINN